MRVFLVLTALSFLCSSSFVEGGLTKEEKTAVEATIDQAVAEAKSTANAARAKLLGEFYAVLVKLDDDSPVIDEIDDQRKAFESEHKLPTHRRMRKAKNVYVKALEGAEETRNKKLADSLSGLKKRDTQFWLATREKVAVLKGENLVPGQSTGSSQTTKRTPNAKGKDDQLHLWKVGTKVEGIRGSDVHVALKGEVISSDEKQLSFKLTDRWKRNGKTYNVGHTYRFERAGLNSKSGVVKLTLVDVKTLARNPVQVFNEAGDLEIDGSKLTGDYQYDWRGKNGKVHSATKRNSFSLRIVK